MINEQILTDMLNNMIVTKASLRVTYDEMVEGTGLSRQTVADVLNPNKRYRSRFDTIVKMLNYFEKVKLEKEGR